MKRIELMKYEGQSCRVVYTNKVGEQRRTGHIYSVTQEVLIFWPFEMEKEVRIPFDDIKEIELI